MSDAPDLQALARRYLDLWQDQMAALASDPNLAETMAKSLTAMGDGAAAMAQAMQQAGHRHEDAHGAQPDAAERTATAAGPSAQPGLDAAELARRIAELEQRVAQLESQLGSGSGSAEPRPRRRRS